MIPLPTWPPSLLPSCSPSLLSFYFLLNLAAYALLSAYSMKRVEFELRACRLEASRVLHLERDVLVREKESLAREREGWEREKEGLSREKNDSERENERLTRENENMAKEKEADRFALEADVEELRGAMTALKKSNDDAEARVLKQAMEFSELKAKWANERDELQLAHTLEAFRQTDKISALTERLRGMEKECDDQSQQIQSLTQEKEDLERTNGDLGDKAVELGDKLYEYHTQITQFVTGDPLAVFRRPPTSDLRPANCEEGERDGEGFKQTQSADSSPCWNLYPGLSSPPRSPYRHERSHARVLGLFSTVSRPEPDTIQPTQVDLESTEEMQD